MGELELNRRRAIYRTVTKFHEIRESFKNTKNAGYRQNQALKVYEEMGVNGYNFKIEIIQSESSVNILYLESAMMSSKASSSSEER
jgi:hypothetical protein